MGRHAIHAWIKTDRKGGRQMIRLAHFVTHPIQYFAPLYRRLALDGRVELKVFFGSSYGTTPSFDREFNRQVEFDVPLLEGYVRSNLTFHFWRATILSFSIIEAAGGLTAGFWTSTAPTS